MNYQEAKEIYQNNSAKTFARQLAKFYKNKGYRGRALVIAVAKDLEKVRKYSELFPYDFSLVEMFVWESSEDGDKYWRKRNLEI